MKKITKRDVGFFFAGVFAMFIIEVVSDWGSQVEAFKDGFNSVRPKAEQIK